MESTPEEPVKKKNPKDVAEKDPPKKDRKKKEQDEQQEMESTPEEPVKKNNPKEVVLEDPPEKDLSVKAQKQAATPAGLDEHDSYDQYDDEWQWWGWEYEYDGGDVEVEREEMKKSVEKAGKNLHQVQLRDMTAISFFNPGFEKPTIKSGKPREMSQLKLNNMKSVHFYPPFQKDTRKEDDQHKAAEGGIDHIIE
jgi:hypothetical protein